MSTQPLLSILSSSFVAGIAGAYVGHLLTSRRERKAGISRESLYRSLSPKGNPTLKTLVAVLNTMGLRLSVVAQPKSSRKSVKKKAAKPARTRAAA
jgi:hypothetical protein